MVRMDRSYIRNPMISMARANPDVEILVRKLKRGKPALLRGHYGEAYILSPCCPSTRLTMVVLVNGRDKVICLNKMEATQVAVKVGFFP